MKTQQEKGSEKMVLWEITLGTAYFLGLRKTYKLALKIQNRLIKPNHPKLHDFVHRRVRAVFDMVLRVHRNIQHRDIEMGRNLGNWMLRWLDRMKPSAQIRAHPEKLPGARSNKSITKSYMNADSQKPQTNSQRPSNSAESGRQFFTSPKHLWSKRFPTISRIMRSPWSSIQNRSLSSSSGYVLRPNYARFGSKEVIRKDIMQWMLRG